MIVYSISAQIRPALYDDTTDYRICNLDIHIRITHVK